MDDMETCSLCADEVLDSTLTETDNGRLCRECVRDDLTLCAPECSSVQAPCDDCHAA